VYAYPNTAQPLIDIVNPHTWHNALHPSLAVGNRLGGGEFRIAASWSQLPPVLRKQEPPLLWNQKRFSAYAARGMRLEASSSGYRTLSSQYQTYGSDALITNPPRVAQSLRGQVSAMLRPTPASGGGWNTDDSMRVFFQMEASVHGANEGDSSPSIQDLYTLGEPRIRSVKAAASPIKSFLPAGADSELELAAWIREEAVAGSLKQRVAYLWTVPRRSATSGIAQIPAAQFETTDPAAEVVAVVPFVGPPGAAAIGRIVWKADDTVWWADVAYVTGTVTVQNVNGLLIGQSGPFPTAETEVSVSPSAIVWSHDGTVLSRRL
jgi:hypothetical protein